MRRSRDRIQKSVKLKLLLRSRLAVVDHQKHKHKHKHKEVLFSRSHFLFMERKVFE